VGDHQSKIEEMSKHSEPEEMSKVEGALVELGAILKGMDDAYADKKTEITEEIFADVEDKMENKVKSLDKTISSQKEVSGQRKTDEDAKARDKEIKKNPEKFFEKADAQLEKEWASVQSGIKSYESAAREKLPKHIMKMRGTQRYRAEDRFRKEVNEAKKALESFRERADGLRQQYKDLAGEKKKYAPLIEDRFHKKIIKSGDPDKYFSDQIDPLQKEKGALQARVDSLTERIDYKSDHSRSGPSDYDFKQLNDAGHAKDEVEKKLKKLEKEKDTFYEKNPDYKPKEKPKKPEPKEESKPKDKAPKEEAQPKEEAPSQDRKEMMKTKVPNPDYGKKPGAQKDITLNTVKKREDTGEAPKGFFKKWWDKLFGKKAADESRLIQAMTRLAHSNRDLRPTLMPIIAQHSLIRLAMRGSPMILEFVKRGYIEPDRLMDTVKKFRAELQEGLKYWRESGATDEASAAEAALKQLESGVQSIQKAVKSQPTTKDDRGKKITQKRFLEEHGEDEVPVRGRKKPTKIKNLRSTPEGTKVWDKEWGKWRGQEEKARDKARGKPARKKTPSKPLKFATSGDFKTDLVKLAYENQELRADLLPLLK